MFKKFIFFSLMAINLFSMEQERINESTYILKDFTDITDDVSKNQAKQSLLQSMRAELLKQINGVSITSANISQRDSSGMTKFDVFGTEEVEGVILDEKVISETKSLKNNMFILELKVQMEVGKQKGEVDGNYQIKVSNLKTTYNDGDKLNLNIEVSKDSYVYIFIKDENDKVYEYYPNIYQKENLLSAKKVLKFPDNRIFDIELNSEGKDTLENLIVIACKEPLNLLGFKYDKEMGLNSERYKELVEQIIKIDKSELITYSSIYKIKGSEKWL